MGISFYPQHSKEEGELLQYSDIAMYCSKERGGNTFEIFDFEMLEPLRIEKMLKSAINNKEFEVYLQPIYSIKRNKIKGFESLIRWNKDNEIIPPDKFIPISKKTGDIVDVQVRAPHPSLEKEARRVIGILPKMKPGRQRGKAVRVPYYLPIKFQVQD